MSSDRARRSWPEVDQWPVGADWGVPPPDGRPRRAPAGPPDPRRRRGRRSREWARWAAVATTGVLALVAIGAVLSVQYARELLGKGQTQVEGLTTGGGGPRNFLLVGSDSRQGLSRTDLARLATEPEAGRRTDSIMLLHVSPNRKQAVMVSIPRDLFVDVPGHRGRVNAAFNEGPSTLVRTVQAATGVPIHHYVEVDFAGFLGVVNALGGVQLCNHTGKRLRDSRANLDMAPGCHQMNGYQALAFVRARYEIPGGDYGRMANQQQFLRQVMDKLADKGNLVNPSKILKVANVLSNHIHTDQHFSTARALDLARQFGSLSANQVDMRVLPSRSRPDDWCGSGRRDCPAYEDLTPEAPVLLRAIARDAASLPPVGLPAGKGVRLADLRVKVLNGSGGKVPGLARRAASGLAALGVQIVGEPENAPTPSRGVSSLHYTDTAENRGKAELLQAVLGPQVRLSPTTSASRHLVLIVDAGYQVVGPATTTTNP